MPSLTVKNIPEEIYERLKKSAAAHRRSINQEAIYCLDRALGSTRLLYGSLCRRLTAWGGSPGGDSVSSRKSAASQAGGC